MAVEGSSGHITTPQPPVREPRYKIVFTDESTGIETTLERDTESGSNLIDLLVNAAATNINNSVGDFSITLPNVNGEYNTYDSGDKVEIWLGYTTPLTKIMTGYIDETPRNKSKGSGHKIVISGRGSGVIMMWRVVGEIYTSSDSTGGEPGEILKDLGEKYAPELDWSEIPTTSGIVLDDAPFVAIYLVEAAQIIADLLNKQIYVDADNKVQLQDKGDRGQTIDFEVGDENIISVEFDPHNGLSLANYVYAYGGAQQVGYEESKTFDGTDSEITLIRKPHNTDVRLNSVLQQGGVQYMTPTGSVDYVLNYHARKIYMTPTAVALSGLTAVVTFNYDIPVFAVADDSASVALHKRRDLIVTNPELTDQTMVQEFADSTKAQRSSTANVGSMKIVAVQTILAGMEANITDAKMGMTEKYKISAVTYSYGKGVGYICDVSFTDQSRKTEDIFASLAERLRRVEAFQSKASAILQTAIVDSDYVDGETKSLSATTYDIDIRAVNDTPIANHPINALAGTALAGDRRGSWTDQETGE